MAAEKTKCRPGWRDRGLAIGGSIETLPPWGSHTIATRKLPVAFPSGGGSTASVCFNVHRARQSSDKTLGDAVRPKAHPLDPPPLARVGSPPVRARVAVSPRMPRPHPPFSAEGPCRPAVSVGHPTAEGPGAAGLQGWDLSTGVPAPAWAACSGLARPSPLDKDLRPGLADNWAEPDQPLV